MLSIAPSVPIYLHAKPIDMRKSFDGLNGIELLSVKKRKRYVAPQPELAVKETQK